MGIAEMQVEQIRESGQEILAKLTQFRIDGETVKAEFADKVWAYEEAYRAGMGVANLDEDSKARLVRDRDRNTREAKEVMMKLLDELHERRYDYLNEFFRRTGNIVKTNDEIVIFGGAKDVCG